MSDSGKAVFLSYASQDAEAAKRICEALRAAGVEVWFDQDELVGGDAWDAKIRGQISACGLFLPVISANTQARKEGYFRIEWRLAAQRTHAMSDDSAFLLPLVIDDTRDADARVPGEFKAVQWTRLPGGETPPAFCARVQKLLSPEQGAGSPEPATRPSNQQPTTNNQRLPRFWWVLPIFGVTMALILVLKEKRDPVPPAAGVPSSAAAAAPAVPEPAVSPLVARALAILDSSDFTKEGLDAAEEFCRQAIARDPTDAGAWAASARVDTRLIYYSLDTSEERRQQAQQKAARALVLAPGSFAARLAQAQVFGNATDSRPMREEAAKRFRQLITERPTNRGLKTELGTILRDLGQFDEAAALFEEVDDLNSAGWNYIAAGRFADAQRVADKWLQRGRNPGVLLLQYVLKATFAQDLVAAHEIATQFAATELLEDGPAMCAMYDGLSRRDAAAVIQVLTAFPREYLAAAKAERGPKRYFLGLAHEIAGNLESARGEWRLALGQMRERQKAAPNDLDSLGWEAVLQARLGERPEAERLLVLFRSKQTNEIRRSAVSVATWTALGQGEKVRAEVEAWHRGGRPEFSSLHADLRFSPEYDALRHEPWFGKFLRDTLPKGAKPFDDQKPLSEARQLVEKATAIWEVWPRTSERLAAAEQLCAQAMKLDGNDGLTWAAASRVDAMMVFQRFDVTPERRQQALKRAARAMALAPEEFEARFAQAYAFSFADESPAMRTEAARIFRRLLQEKPDHRRTLIDLGTTLRELAQYDEAATLFERAGDVSSLGWNYFVAGRFEEAARVADRMLARERTAGAIQLKVQAERSRGNLDAAQAAVDRFTPDELLKEDFLVQAEATAIVRREYDRAIQLLNAYPEEFLNVNGFNGPKRLLLGRVHELAGRPAAARREWQTALRQLDEDLGAKGTNVGLIVNRAVLLAYLGEKEEAERALRLAQELSLSSTNRLPVLASQLRLGHKEEALATLEKVFGERKQGWLNLYLSVRWNPDFDMLRGAPPFDKLMRDNLPPGVKPFEEAKTQ